LGVCRSICKGLEHNSGYAEPIARVPSKHWNFWKNAKRTTKESFCLVAWESVAAQVLGSEWQRK
jgi:hypothetical protein